MGQDQVSGGVSVLCWLATPVAMFYGNLQNLVIKSKSVIKRKRKRSDSVLWQKPLHQQKCQKGKVTTQTTPQKSSIKQRLRTDLGRSVGVTKVQFGNKFANWCNVWSIECVIVYGHVQECHVTFGKGRLHNVWWDPHIDHKKKTYIAL